MRISDSRRDMLKLTLNIPVITLHRSSALRQICPLCHMFFCALNLLKCVLTSASEIKITRLSKAVGGGRVDLLLLSIPTCAWRHLEVMHLYHVWHSVLLVGCDGVPTFCERARHLQGTSNHCVPACADLHPDRDHGELVMIVWGWVDNVVVKVLFVQIQFANCYSFFNLSSRCSLWKINLCDTTPCSWSQTSCLQVSVGGKMLQHRLHTTKQQPIKIHIGMFMGSYVVILIEFILQQLT